MIISHRRRFIAYSPWKTASSTLYARLSAFDEGPYSHFYDFNPYLNRVVHQHLTCADLASLPESKLDYFRVSFIRNPYDRVYSGFQQLQRDLAEQTHATYPQEWIRDLVMRQLSENFTQLSKAHFEFDAWLSLLDERQIFEAGHNTSLPLHPAHYWTHIAGQQAVDFIGRVESFETDFTVLCDRLDLNDILAVNANVSSDGDAASDDTQTYRYASRMNRHSIDKINSLFDRDFALFGYAKL